MFDIKFITKVRAAFCIGLLVLSKAADSAVEDPASLRLAWHAGARGPEKTYGTVLAAICFCSFLYPIATPALPADRA